MIINMNIDMDMDRFKHDSSWTKIVATKPMVSYIRLTRNTIALPLYLSPSLHLFQGQFPIRYNQSNLF